MKVIASRQIPIVNTHQVVWQPVTDNGDRSMRLAPIDWQPSGAHACIQMLADDLRNAEAKLTKTMAALRNILSGDDLYPWRIAREVLVELNADIYKDNLTNRT